VRLTVSCPEPGRPTSTARSTNVCLPWPLADANPVSSRMLVPGIRR
jgi:hypothetical protein